MLKICSTYQVEENTEGALAIKRLPLTRKMAAKNTDNFLHVSKSGRTKFQQSTKNTTAVKQLKMK